MNGLVYSVWQTPPGGNKFGIQTLIIEVETLEEANDIANRYRMAGQEVRVAGPHEPQETESDFPLEY